MQYAVTYDTDTGEYVATVDGEVIAVSEVAAVAYAALAAELLADETE